MKANSSIFNSNIMKFLRNAFLFVLILISLLYIIGELMESKFTKEYTNIWIEETNNIDILILGSSQAEYGYDKSLLSEKMGLNVFNAGAKGQQPDSTYYTLLDILEQHNPQTIILDIYWRTLNGDVDISQLVRSYENIIDPTVKKTFFNEGFDYKHKLNYLIPILRYRQDFHWFLEAQINNLLERDKGDKKTEKNSSEQNNNTEVKVISEKLIYEENKFRYSSGSIEFNPRELIYIEKIIELLNSKNIELYIIAAPILPESLSFVKNYDEIHTILSTLTNKHQKEYLDFNLQNMNGELVDRSHFRDENHMNSLGAAKFTEYLFHNILSVEVSEDKL